MKHQEKNPATNPNDAARTRHLRPALTPCAELPDSATMSAAGERVWQRVSQEALLRLRAG